MNKNFINKPPTRHKNKIMNTEKLTTDEIEAIIYDIKDVDQLADFLESLPRYTQVDIKPMFSTINLYKTGDIWEVTSTIDGIEIYKVDSIDLAKIILRKKSLLDI